jgi:hypothetical protein
MPMMKLVGPPKEKPMLELVRKPNVQEIWLSSTKILALLETRQKTMIVHENILIGK